MNYKTESFRYLNLNIQDKQRIFKIFMKNMLKISIMLSLILPNGKTYPSLSNI